MGERADSFWRQTPRLFALVVQGKVQHADTERRRSMEVAWTTAALQRVKKLPPLKELLGEPAKRRASSRPKTSDELLFIAKAWSAVAPPKKKRGRRS